VSSSLQRAASLKPLFEECGYTGARLQANYQLGDLEIPLVGFASSERDMDSACIVAIDGGTDPEAAVRSCYELAAPVVWVRHNGSVDWWIQRPGKPERFDTKPVDQFPALVRKYKSKLDPLSIYQGRTLARINPAKQLEFVDAGLLPLRREEAGKKLHDTVQSMIAATLKAMGRPNPSKVALRDVFTSVFRLLAGKILADKGIGGFPSLDLYKPKDVLEAVARHYDTSNTNPAPPKSDYMVLKDAASQLAQTGSFAVVSPESLAYVYEHTLVTKELRKKLGIHATPPWLVDYMVWQLYDWVREIPVGDGHVFEPACGHAPFLLSMMRLLRMEMDNQNPSAVHAYLKDHIHGVEIDDFAREIARLTLTLADIPNPNGWDLKGGNMFTSEVLVREASRCHILLSNPPYEKFSAADKKRCAAVGYPLSHKKAVELISRTIDKLPARSVFGLVVPQTIISGPEARHIRKFLLERCELAEVCRFPGKVFQFAQIETAIILGRRSAPQAAVAQNRVRLRTVGERGMPNFRESYQADENESATQADLLAQPALELKVPSLHSVWKWLSANRRIRDVAAIGRGIEYKGEAGRNGKPVVSANSRPGFVRGFAKAHSKQVVFSRPPDRWLCTDQNRISSAGFGLTTGLPQVLVNRGRASRFHWRIKALLDDVGHVVKDNFVVIRPHRNGEYALFLWAIMNSPLANAYVASRTMRKHNYEGILSEIPLPIEEGQWFTEIVEAARVYRRLASARATGISRRNAMDANHSPLFDGPKSAESITSENEVREALLQLDATILRAYALPARLERQLLDYFNGNDRAGVGCIFGDYYPPGFKSLVPLHKFISSGYRRSTVNQVEARFKPNGTSAGTAALRAATEAFGGDD
jgi:hypothetical protein